jgi:hypothetical protein
VLMTLLGAVQRVELARRDIVPAANSRDI